MPVEKFFDLTPPSWGPVIIQKGRPVQIGEGGRYFCREKGYVSHINLCTHIVALSYKDDLFNNRKVNFEKQRQINVLISIKIKRPIY